MVLPTRPIVTDRDGCHPCNSCIARQKCEDDHDRGDGPKALAGEKLVHIPEGLQFDGVTSRVGPHRKRRSMSAIGRNNLKG